MKSLSEYFGPGLRLIFQPEMKFRLSSPQPVTLLTRSGFLSMRLTVAQLVKKVPDFYGTQSL
jgi:hypothetical protein